MISEAEIIDRWTLIRDCITKPDGGMQAAVTLTGWFEDENHRIYRLLTESQADRDLRQAAHWIGQ